MASNSYAITTASVSSQSIENNCSYVHVITYGQTDSGTYNGFGTAYATLYGEVSTDAGYQKREAETIYFNVSKNKYWCIYDTIIGPFYHNNDGSCPAIAITSYTKWVSSPLVAFTKTASVTPSNIARETNAPSSQAFTIGTQRSLSLSPYSNSFTHDAYIDDKSIGSGGSSFNVTAPTSLYSSTFPQRTGSNAALKIKTKLNGSYIGSGKTATCTLYPNASSYPTFNVSVEDSNSSITALTGSNKRFVRGKSVAHFTISNKTYPNSGAFNSLTLNGTSIGNVGTYDTLFDGSAQYNVVLTDKRNTSTTKALSSGTDYFDIGYVTPTLSKYSGKKSFFYRSSQTANDMYYAYSGNWFNHTFGNTNNTLKIEYRVKKQDSGTWSSWITLANLTASEGANTFSNSGTSLSAPPNIGSWNYTQAYNFEIRITDKLGGDTQGDSLSMGVPNFTIYPNATMMNSALYINGIKVLYDDGN